jgi:hypothetical protein
MSRRQEHIEPDASTMSHPKLFTKRNPFVHDLNEMEAKIGDFRFHFIQIMYKGISLSPPSGEKGSFLLTKSLGGNSLLRIIDTCSSNPSFLPLFYYLINTIRT